MGAYIPKENLVYILKDAEQHQKVQILLHELVHAAMDQVASMEEEGRTDALASWLMRLFNVTNVEELYML